MSISINTDTKNLPDVPLHHLPCKIDANEKADVKSFFIPKVEQVNNTSVYKASFRGYPLDGKIIEIPNEYSGYIMNEKNKPFSEEITRQIDVIGKFKTLTKWYLDSQYYGNNAMENVCSIWVDNLAKAIHEPIDPE